MAGLVEEEAALTWAVLMEQAKVTPFGRPSAPTASAAGTASVLKPGVLGDRVDLINADANALLVDGRKGPTVPSRRPADSSDAQENVS